VIFGSTAQESRGMSNSAIARQIVPPIPCTYIHPSTDAERAEARNAYSATFCRHTNGNCHVANEGPLAGSFNKQAEWQTIELDWIGFGWDSHAANGDASRSLRLHSNASLQ